MPISRRDVLHGLPAAALFGAAAPLSSPLLLSRAEAQVTPDAVRFRPEIEPLVALIERTPREQCAEMAVEQLRRGVSYRQLLGALFLAGIRNVNPRPPGFAMHCVFVIHSAHLMSLEAPADSRLLSLFYALDTFKASQERDARAQTGDYTMRPIRGPLPAADRAEAELAGAMEAWDMERAERAVVSLARHRSSTEVFDLMWRYGARDYRNIGHKAIFVANAYRTLEAIGWQHSEPVLRSLALGLLDFGKQQSVNGYAFEDQCYAGNLKRVKESFARLPDGWVAEDGDAAATRSILDTLRAAKPEEACADVAARLVKGTANQGAVWNAVHLAAAELRMRTRSQAILGIHTVTSANGLHYGFQAAYDAQMRFLILLQAAGWMSQFRNYAQSREENLRSFPITNLEPSADDAPLDRALAEIFAGIPKSVDASASRILRLARDPAGRQAFIATALRHTIAKADEVHYYKYLAAMIEDVPLVSPEWQPHLVAGMAYYIKGSQDAEPAAMKRAREALKGLGA